MAKFEVIGYGFNGLTDSTDERVVWVQAPSRDSLQGWLEGTMAYIAEDDLPEDSDCDFSLDVTGDGERLRKRLWDFRIPTEGALPEVLPTEEIFVSVLSLAMQAGYSRLCSEPDDFPHVYSDSDEFHGELAQVITDTLTALGLREFDTPEYMAYIHQITDRIGLVWRDSQEEEVTDEQG